MSYFIRSKRWRTGSTEDGEGFPRRGDRWNGSGSGGWYVPVVVHEHRLMRIAVALKTSLPSNEPAGARPGERSSGVGALPGKSTETGVAVLPDEKSKSDIDLPSAAV